MTLTVSLLLLLGLTATQAALVPNSMMGDCVGTGAAKGSEYCYQVYPTPTVYAKTWCANLHGTLAIPSSQADMDAVLQAVKNQPGLSGQVYIGLSKAANAGVIKTATKTPITDSTGAILAGVYNNFKDETAYKLVQGKAQCGVLDAATGAWSMLADPQCKTGKLPFVCQAPLFIEGK